MGTLAFAQTEELVMKPTEKLVYERPYSLAERHTHYCPGCTHGTAHRLIAEVIDELGIQERSIIVAPVGCSVFAYDYFHFDMLEVAHGRPPAAATGLKRSMPDRIIFSYQGDGDLAAIGTGEIVHAANRGENISVFFINNATYGMTGGQMAPTTLCNQKTTTTPRFPEVQEDNNIYVIITDIMLEIIIYFVTILL